MSTLAVDVAATRRAANSTMYHIAIVGMVGSLFTSGLAFYLLTGHYWAIAEGVLVAATVDYGLLRWMGISARLRKVNAAPQSGKVLDRTVAVMTLYLNGSAGLAPLVEPKTAVAYVMLTVAHLFIPIVMLMVFIACPNAQILLQAKERAELDALDRRNRIASEEQAAKDRAAAVEREKTQRTENSRREAEAKDRTRQREIADSQHAREAENRRMEIDRDRQRIAAMLALSTVYLAKLDNIQAITEKVRRQLRDRDRRQRHRQPGDAVLPARRQASSPGVRQGPSPAPGAAKPQETPDVAALAELAKHLLANEPGMGRAALANELGVTPHYARLALDHIKTERDAAKDAELTAMLETGR